MATIRSSSLTAAPARGGAESASRAAVNRVTAQMQVAAEALAERASQVALERRSLVESIQDESLRRSVSRDL
jgi:hypothetical protein